MKKKNEGITLIALVVTIIVLMILAGVSVSMLTGQNGILNRAAEAKENTDSSSDLEELQIKAYEALTNYYASGSNESESEYILKNLNGAGIVADEKTGTVTYNGKTYDISDIMGKTGEQKAIAAQTDVKLKQITKATATEAADIALFNTGKIRMIIQEENDATNRAVIPNGFYYVTGAPSTGLVVSDKFDDDDNNSKGGNQFVWVPCTTNTEETNKIVYEGVKRLGETWSKYNKYYQYKEYTDWEDNGGNTTSVAKYGGFYIARYEAGVPSNASFYANSNGATYSYNKNPSTAQIITDTETNLTEEQLASKLIPVSKKNNQSWNCISQSNAKDVAKSMYYNSSVVTSSLVDSYAWDTIVEWMSKDSSYNADNGQTIGYVSTKFGNYYDNTSITASNALYAAHRYGGHKEGTNVSDYWSWGTKYSKGNVNTAREYVTGVDGPNKYPYITAPYDDTNYTYNIRKELATGASNDTKVKNIYDMAGNMWEWTTETGKHGEPSNTTTWAVLRGGSFSYHGSDYPVSGRVGSSTVGDYSIGVGFRVVLYIQQ